MRIRDLRPKPLAVLCSDIHLSAKAPVARSEEPDWFEAQRRGLSQLLNYALGGDLPIICAGDVFDKWNTPAELINFALDHLPTMYAIPGQHDLPYHNLGDMHRSAFGTLVRAGKLIYLEPGKPHRIADKLWAWGFPWGVPIEPQTPSEDDAIQLAVVHAYIWRKGRSYPGASKAARVAAFAKRLHGFNSAVFGDNHKGFLANARGCHVYNHGAFYRRTADEIDYRPHVGILMSDGSVECQYLDTSEDLFLKREDPRLIEEDAFTMQEFLKELEGLGDSSIDFRSSLKQYFDTYEVSPGTRKLLLEAIE